MLRTAWRSTRSTLRKRPAGPARWWRRLHRFGSRRMPCHRRAPPRGAEGSVRQIMVLPALFRAAIVRELRGYPLRDLMRPPPNPAVRQRRQYASRELRERIRIVQAHWPIHGAFRVAIRRIRGRYGSFRHGVSGTACARKQTAPGFEAEKSTGEKRWALKPPRPILPSAGYTRTRETDKSNAEQSHQRRLRDGRVPGRVIVGHGGRNLTDGLD